MPKLVDIRNYQSVSFIMPIHLNSMLYLLYMVLVICYMYGTCDMLYVSGRSVLDSNKALNPIIPRLIIP